MRRWTGKSQRQLVIAKDCLSEGVCLEMVASVARKMFFSKSLPVHDGTPVAGSRCKGKETRTKSSVRATVVASRKRKVSTEICPLRILSAGCLAKRRESRGGWGWEKERGEGGVVGYSAASVR